MIAAFAVGLMLAANLHVGAPPEPPDPQGVWGCYYGDADTVTYFLAIQPAVRGGWITTWRDTAGVIRYTGTWRWNADRGTFVERWRSAGATGTGAGDVTEWEWGDGGAIDAAGRSLNLRK